MNQSVPQPKFMIGDLVIVDLPKIQPFQGIIKEANFDRYEKQWFYHLSDPKASMCIAESDIIPLLIN